MEDIIKIRNTYIDLKVIKLEDIIDIREEITLELDITEKRLNKWSNKIEKNYMYEFSRNEKGQRIFSKKDKQIIIAYKNKILGNINESQFQRLAPKRLNRGSVLAKKNTVTSFNYADDPSVCSACGKRIRNVYGTSRCGCN